MPDSMNRPHIAALLRTVAEEIAGAEIYADMIDDPALKAEVDRLISETAAGLRQRADEIEGRT